MSKVTFYPKNKINAIHSLLCKKFVRSMLILCSSLSMISCASTANSEKSAKSAPDWVITGSSASYPKSAYLIGIGTAAQKRSAQIDAINELVSMFGQNISSATNASHRMEMAQSAGLVAHSEAAALEQDLLREVNQNDVIAVEIPEFFESKSEGKFYALAVMSREKGTQIYSGMIEKNQNEISSIIKQISSEKEPNTLLNFSRLDFAEEVAQINEGYLKRLVVLNPSAAKKFDSISTPVQIHKMKTEMAEKIPICVKLSNESEDSDGRVTKAFQEVMSSFGFNTTNGSNERYVIDCKIHFNQSASSNAQTQFCEYALEASLNDTFSGETLIPLSITGREGSPTYQNAQIRAKQKIIARIKSDFSANFQKNFLQDFDFGFTIE
ncbi:LPP20 family lipoprotein [uncultured Treponema sp.]|uniref:LPP20 family lipoprotein n=1 Tax=uncultured Treponema sp. TaxID=162155 RepID=UPI0025DB60D9|nr:LPP20 family lipoprotein [uncultured Treponema sp.]